MGWLYKGYGKVVAHYLLLLHYFKKPLKFPKLQNSVKIPSCFRISVERDRIYNICEARIVECEWLSRFVDMGCFALRKIKIG